MFNTKKLNKRRAVVLLITEETMRPSSGSKSTLDAIMQRKQIVQVHDNKFGKGKSKNDRSGIKIV